MELDLDALQMLPGEETAGLIGCTRTCDWTCSWTSLAN
jgi:hypothetical protein